MQGGVDRDDIANAHQRLGVRVEGHVQLLLHVGREAMPIGIVQLDVEGLEAAEDRRADASRSHRAHRHSFQIVGAGYTVGDVPSAVHDPLIRRDVIAHQRQDHHHDVLRHADAVAVRDLGDGHPSLDGCLQVYVIRSNARRNGQLQLPRLGDALCREVRRPERL